MTHTYVHLPEKFEKKKQTAHFSCAACNDMAIRVKIDGDGEPIMTEELLAELDKVAEGHTPHEPEDQPLIDKFEVV